ncbi:MAG: AraC family transcriptional regulator [bacterium]|nr:AraC family transcriptional regulator [bacterium]
MVTWIDQSELVEMAKVQSGASIMRDLHRRDGKGEDFPGRIEFLPIEEGLFCSVNEWRSAHGTTDRTVVRNSIGLQFVKMGQVRQNLSGHGRYLHTGARVCLTTFPAETRQVRHYGAGLDVKYIGAWVAPDLLVDKFGLSVDALPEPLRAFFMGDSNMPYSMSLPLAPRLWMALDEVFASGFTGKLRDTYLRSKMTELICEMTASLGRMGHSNRPVEEGALSSRELMLVEAAAMVYMKELHAPPSVDALATRVGLNRNKLNSGFRELFDCTPHEYSKRLRMDWARRLIEDRALCLGEIAQAVGYASQSAFSRAYADYFGFPPSERVAMKPD